MNEVEQFVRVAREYCEFVETAGRLTPEERRDTAREQFASLYAAAVRLPFGALDEGDYNPEVPTPSWPGFGIDALYWCVLEPFKKTDQPNVGCALLDGDVLETYSEIKEGLLQWDAGRQGSAVFDWRTGFHAHWGAHVAHALWALHAHWAEA